MLKKAGNLFTTAYLVLIFCVYLFYMEEGFVDIGKAKYHFLIYSSFAAVCLLGLIALFLAGKKLYQRKKAGEAYLIQWENLSLTDLLVILYATELLGSCALSVDRKEALCGTEGWYMGTVLLLSLCVLYFLISRLWQGKKEIFYMSLMASGIVFVLGILDRFSIYLLPLAVRQPDFISTLGNINWFSGYLAVIAPIGAGLFVFGNECRWKWAFGAYTVVSFMAGLCQGAESILLFFGALFFVLFWISVKNGAWLCRSFLLPAFWGFSALLLRVMDLLLTGGYNYDKESLCYRMIHSDGMLALGVVSFGIYLILRWKRFAPGEREQRIIHRSMIAAFAGVGFLWLFLAVYHTRIGIPGLENNHLFLLDAHWGNGRGGAFGCAFEAFRQMSFRQKLLGVGADCFSFYVYSLPDVAEKLKGLFGSSRLTNAHSELLTCLVNNGVLGTGLYLSIFVCFIRKCMKRGKENGAAYLYVLCVICYFIHNVVSFAQVLNLPFLFLLLGMGEAQLRKLP